MERLCDGLVKFIGETHRPVALLIVAVSFFWAVVNRSDASTLGAIGLVLGGVYWGKSAENIVETKNPKKELA